MADIRLADVGEYYADILKVDSWINNKTMATQANSLLCAKLQEREGRIRTRVQYLARKRGVSENALWLEILKGDAKEMTAKEVAQIESLETDE